MTTGCLPKFVIIGAQKCGTTSLHYYLNLHPDISMSREKETNFFIEECNWHKGIDWYRKHFNGDSPVCGEASPGYTVYPHFQGVPQRMHSVLPNAKLIYILRDPVERIISHYLHRYAVGQERRPITEAVMDNNGLNPYLFRSRYFLQLKQYLPFYSQSCILIMTAEELQRKRRATLQKVFRFLNVDDSYWSARFGFMWHRSKFKRQSPEKLNPAVIRATSAFLKKIPFEMRGLIERILWLPFSKQVEMPVIETQLRRRVITFLEADTKLLRRFMAYGFDEWCV